WSLPFNDELNADIAAHEVCIVGVFGKSAWGHVSKGMVINKLADTSLFQPHYPNYATPQCDQNRTVQLEKFMPKIDAYYDQKKKIVFLHLTTTLDAAAIAGACAEMGSKLMNHSDSHHFWKSQDAEVVISLVFLFSVCHILILSHPVPMFDISYDSLFHHISNFRTKLMPLIKDILKDCTVGRDWWVNGRPCPPRLLFVIQKSHLSNKKSSEATGDSSKKKKPPLKRLQHTLEDQIYKILRNSRVLTNNAVHCLFTVPPNQAFVHIMTKQYNQVKQEEDPIKGMLNLLRKSCETHRDPTAKSRAYRLLTNPPTQWEDGEEDVKENPIWDFLSQHTELVFEKKGFRDSVGRNPLPTHFELPTLKNWIKVANELHRLMFSTSLKIEKDEALLAKTAEIKQQLQVQMDPENRFSEARCSKVVSLASAAYQSNLPLHYTSKVHRNQLAQALATYMLHARGPAKEKYEVCVQAEFRSLTGRHCVHRFHDLPDDLKSQPDANPPKIFHSSRSRSLAASSCVRLGCASIYTPIRGLDFPGFLPGTNYLVPWEIPIMTEEPGTTQWPVPGEARKLPIKETKLTLREATTKAYIGYEYETPRGQRFICSGPDKSVKVTSSGVVRDPIQPLLDLNMPLFTLSPVSGRSGKMLTGQLMRVIIVTPQESSVRVIIKPQVVPGPNPTPTFYPSDPEISLRPNSMWVLRLPYVYVSETGPHIQPKDSSQLQAWRVLKMLSVEVEK
uniref:Nonsense-mediated mRNA decay factor SMG8 n=1 Tax=Ciona savignyi TaxID=51511 RepID=H2ZMM6_CIOSA